MQPTQVNAAQLLMSFMDSEQGKLSKKIAPSQFSRELEAEQSKLMQNVGGNPEQTLLGASNQNQNGVDLTPDAKDGIVVLSGKEKARADEKAFGNQAAQKKASRISREKVKESLVFINPLVIEKIVGQLQIPAEKRQACMNAVDSQGSLSLKALSAILTQKAGPEQPTMVKPVVAAQDVRSLINSLRQVQGDQVRALPQMEAQGSGSFSLDQFRELLDAVVHQVANAQAGQRQRSTQPSTPGAQTELEGSEEAASPSAISPDRVERLTASSLPPFCEEDISGDKENSRSVLTRAQSEAPKGEGPDNVDLQAATDEATPEDASSKTRSTPTAPERPLSETGRRPQGTHEERIPVDRKVFQPEPRAADRPQSPLSDLIGRFKLQNVFIQSEVSSQSTNMANTPSVNLVSSLAAGFEGKVEIKGLANDKAPPQSFVDPTGNLLETSPKGDKVTAPRDSSNAAWEGSHEGTGRDLSFSHNDKESGPIHDTGHNGRVLTGRDQLFSLNAKEALDIPDLRRNGQGMEEMIRTSPLIEQEDTGYAKSPIRIGQETAGSDASALLNGKSADVGHATQPTGISQPATGMNDAASTRPDQDVGQTMAASQTGGGNEELTSNGERDGNACPQNGDAKEKPGPVLPGSGQSRPSFQQTQPLDPVVQEAKGPATSGSPYPASGEALRGEPISTHLASWPEALAQRLRQVHQEGRSQMTLELEPNHLGKLSLRIETHQDRVTAFIAADNEQAKALLLQNSSALRQHLHEQGLQLDQFFVGVREDGSHPRRFFQQNGFTKRESGNRQRAQNTDKSELAALSSVYGRKADQQLISLFA